jgi:integrase
MARLSAVKVTNLKGPGYFADGDRLYFRIAPSGARGWIFRFTLNNRTRDMGLGSYPGIGLAAARELAGTFRRLLKEGIDPIEWRRAKAAPERVAAAKSLNFDDCVREYIKAHEVGWRNAKHRAQWSSTLATYASPVFGKLPISAIDTGLVLRALEAIWYKKPETASRVRGRIESVLDWARVHGFRSGENPALWKGHLDHLLPRRSKIQRVRHHAALPFAELGAFMAALRKREGVAARALEFTILTAARTGEALGATWDEIDSGGKTWTVSAERMKAGEEHRVPLSAAAIAILERLHEVRRDDFVFPGVRAGRPLSEMAMLKLLQRMECDVTVHGFRSTFRDWAAECTNFPDRVAEMALAHAVIDAVEAAYRRGDLIEKRRRLMEAWADFCSISRASANVTPLRTSETRSRI